MFQPREWGWDWSFQARIPGALPHGTDSAGLHPSRRMVSGGLPEVRDRRGRLVSGSPPDTEWQASSDPRRTSEDGREVRRLGVAYLPPHLPFLAGRHRRSHRGAAEADAARPDLNHNERLRKRFDGGQAGGQQQGGPDGTEERLSREGTLQQKPQTPHNALAIAVIWGYLGLAFGLNGCGGWI